ncbi:DUF421 domain-containing protein [Paenibacillus aurantius]|uniref:DUF421 domain-containing protein n=1 Tax=Paenibacillus aurantius TaxID=2918900 RepID=A0AA96LJS4_9BACL|nr:DUF421 domain-containing protein [Paenibacillus aurantius]WNQ13400.1 DUF421 domain-containing protein [Paenibacillus aurantius]
MPDWSVIALRSLGAVVMLFVLTRILGKKQISQLTFFEYVVGITLGELAGFISTDIEAHYFLGVTALLVWFLSALLVEMVTLKSRSFRNWMEGKSRILIQKGKVLEDNLKKERLSGDELLEELRKKNVFQVAEVEFAVMEPSGDINVLLKKENQPLTPKHLGITVAPESEPQTVIMDGIILDEPLSTLGFSRGWLLTELEKAGVAVENVFLGQADQYGELFIDTFDDMIKVPKPQTKQLLLATLKKCQADLELYALSTSNGESKRIYADGAMQLTRNVEHLTPLLQR